MKSNKYYILICADVEDLDGKRKVAYEVAKERLSKTSWPIFHRTSFKNKISQNDHCMFYLAGLGPYSQCFFAQATVMKVNDWDSNKLYDDDLLCEFPEKILILNDINYFNPVSIRSLISELDLTKKVGNKWGCVMQGGCKNIKYEDFKKILENSS